MCVMAKYFALHKTIGDPAAGWEFFSKGAPALAAAMAAGQMPAKCLMTWNPFTYGRGDYVFCLWEAENLEAIVTVLNLSGLVNYVTSDIMPVTEIDWAELALTVPEKAAT
jgi:hypothetical protein